VAVGVIAQNARDECGRWCQQQPKNVAVGVIAYLSARAGDREGRGGEIVEIGVVAVVAPAVQDPPAAHDNGPMVALTASPPGNPPARLAVAATRG